MTKGIAGTGWSYGTPGRCRSCNQQINCKPFSSCPEEHKRNYARIKTYYRLLMRKRDHVLKPRGPENVSLVKERKQE